MSTPINAIYEAENNLAENLYYILEEQILMKYLHWNHSKNAYTVDTISVVGCDFDVNLKKPIVVINLLHMDLICVHSISLNSLHA